MNQSPPYPGYEYLSVSFETRIETMDDIEIGYLVDGKLEYTESRKKTL